MRAPLSCEWSSSPTQECGILCGAEKSQEWLLPWWWSCYQPLHQFPVTFCDFGMSLEMRQWCLLRGEVLSVELEPSLIAQPQDLPQDFISHAESVYGKRIWSSRPHWFKKPFALLKSPYKTTLWLDIDCEILASLAPLFSQFDPSLQVALVREFSQSHLPIGDPLLSYNGGVIVFQHGSSLIQKWAQGVFDKNHLFLGDDHLLSHLIYSNQVAIQELSPLYNWRISQGLNLNASIIHWVGEGKEYIRKYGGLKPQLERMFKNQLSAKK